MSNLALERMKCLRRRFQGWVTLQGIGEGEGKYGEGGWKTVAFKVHNSIIHGKQL